MPWNLRGISDRSQLGLEWGIDSAEAVPVHTSEEWVSLDLVGSVPSQPLVGRCDKAPNEILGFRAQQDLLREIQLGLPVHDLPVGLVGILGTERRPSNEALEHDCTQTPPVAFLTVTRMEEYLRCNIIRGTHCGVRHQAAGSPPGVNLVTVRYGEVDGVYHHGVPRARSLISSRRT